MFLILQKSAEERASTVTISGALLGYFTVMALMNVEMAVMNHHPALITSGLFTEHCLDIPLA